MHWISHQLNHSSNCTLSFQRKLYTFRIVLYEFRAIAVCCCRNLVGTYERSFSIVQYERGDSERGENACRGSGASPIRFEGTFLKELANVQIFWRMAVPWTSFLRWFLILGAESSRCTPVFIHRNFPTDFSSEIFPFASGILCEFSHNL